MPDPIDWGNVIESPQIWGSVLVFLGVFITQWVVNRKNKAELESKRAELAAKKDETGLATIQATVDILSAEVNRLSGELEKLREKVDSTEKRYRLLTEKYSAAIAYIVSLWTAAQGLFTRLDAENIPHGDIPQPPEIIAVDMTPLQE